MKCLQLVTQQEFLVAIIRGKTCMPKCEFVLEMLFYQKSFTYTSPSIYSHKLGALSVIDTLQFFSLELSSNDFHNQKHVLFLSKGIKNIKFGEIKCFIFPKRSIFHQFWGNKVLYFS